MASFSGNTLRSNSRLRPRARGAGMALALAGGAALAGASALASAAVPAGGARPFVFTAYSDAAGGAEVVAGRYHTALEELQSHPDATDLDPAASNTNRCVAYSMTLQWRQARAACDAAVDATDERRTEYLALAYANRAVMHWLTHDEAAARQDLAKARALSPAAGFVTRNVAAFAAHGMMALAATPAPKR
jgi:hypothetical protein